MTCRRRSQRADDNIRAAVFISTADVNVLDGDYHFACCNDNDEPTQQGSGNTPIIKRDDYSSGPQKDTESAQ